MLSSIVEKHGLTVRDITTDAFSFFRNCLQSDGSVAENPGMGTLLEWDSVCALKAITLWLDYASSRVWDAVNSLLGFLASHEKLNGMLSWGSGEIGPGEYCTEISSEYISCLASLRDGRARGKAEFLRDRQRPDGAWAEVHSHIPKAFQCEASVTGFALLGRC